jgi:hypothetical protein
MTPSETPQLKNRIRKLRFEHGEMTRQELADRVGAARQNHHRAGGGQICAVVAIALRG